MISCKNKIAVIGPHRHIKASLSSQDQGLKPIAILQILKERERRCRFGVLDSHLLRYVGIGRHGGGYMMHTNTVPRNWIVHSTGWRAEQGLRRPGLRSYRAYAETGRIGADSPKLDEPRPSVHAAGARRNLEEMAKKKKKERVEEKSGRGRVERRKKRVRSRRDARKCCAMPCERESRRKHRREFRYSRRTAAAVVASPLSCLCHEREYAPHAYMRACYVYAYIRSSRPGLPLESEIRFRSWDT